MGLVLFVAAWGVEAQPGSEAEADGHQDLDFKHQSPPGVAS